MSVDVFATCMDLVGSRPALPVALFIAGMFGGVTHCSLQCGVFVVGLSSDGNRSLIRVTGFDLLPYHLGRIVTYVALAAILGMGLHLVPLTVAAWLTPLILAVAGCVFLGAALVKLPSRYPGAPILHRIRTRLHHLGGGRGRFVMGILMGFMPCAMSASAIVAASTAKTGIDAAAAMAAFGFGTTIGLMPLPVIVRALGRHMQPPAWLRPSVFSLSGLCLLTIAGRLMIEG